MTLVEENETYQTCFHSNLYVGGFKTYEEIIQPTTRWRKNHGITLARARATSIDRDKKEVVLSTGQRLPYDRLVVSPGIDLKYDSVPGWSQSVRGDDAACLEARPPDAARSSRSSTPCPMAASS